MDPQLPRQGLQEDVAKLPPPLTIPQSLHPKCLAIKKHGAIFKESKMQQRTKSNTKTYQNNEREKRKVSLIEGNQVTIGNFHTKLVFCKTHILRKKGWRKVERPTFSRDKKIEKILSRPSCYVHSFPLESHPSAHPMALQVRPIAPCRVHPCLAPDIDVFWAGVFQAMQNGKTKTKKLGVTRLFQRR